MSVTELAVIPGDGIGSEVVAEGLKVLNAAGELDGGLTFRPTAFPWSCAYYLEHGRMMPEDGIRTLASFPAIYLGAVGAPGVADHVSLWGLLLPIRREFDQYVNLRPIKLLQKAPSPLRDLAPGAIDYVIVRENTEGEYSNSGGRFKPGTPDEVVIQNSIFTRKGTERILRYAYDLAMKRGKRLISATKSNGINVAMPFWDEVFHQIGQGYPEVEARLMHCDALAAHLVLRPQTLDVVVGSNLFGDILSDLGAATVGGIGLAPSANLNPERRYPSMFEPVHGSAPDIAGRGIANPTGAIWTAALLLDHLGKPELARVVMQALEAALAEGSQVTPDLGGTASTREMGDAVVARMRAA
ncbi:MAG: tartrate dehydrogenase [Bacillota bacterium]